MKTKYTVPHRRKREGKTNYKKRLELLKGRKDRLVIRKTNTQLIIQIVRYEEDGDKVLLTYQSKSLEKEGWKHSKNNIPASYLAGLAAGKQAQSKKVKEAVLDIGLQSPKKGGRIYSALKGVVDSGLKIPVNEEIFPSEDRLLGKHIKEDLSKDVESTKSKIMK